MLCGQLNMVWHEKTTWEWLLVFFPSELSGKCYQNVRNQHHKFYLILTQKKLELKKAYATHFIWNLNHDICDNWMIRYMLHGKTQQILHMYKNSVGSSIPDILRP
jgi:hypothetical protein